MPILFITQIAGKDSSKTENKLNPAAVLLYRRRFLLLIRDHFFDAGEGYGTDDMLDPAGIFFRGVRGNVQDVGQENSQRFMPVQNRGRFFQAVFRQHDPPVGLHNNITAFFQDTHGTGYAGLGKIHFRCDINGTDVTVALLQYQYRLQVVFTGFQKRHNYFLLIIQMDYHYQVLINCNIEIRLTQPIAVKWGIRRNRVRCPGMVV